MSCADAGTKAWWIGLLQACRAEGLADGVTWRWHGTVLGGRDGCWDARDLDVLPLPDSGHRLYHEARRPDGAHELRTELHA